MLQTHGTSYRHIGLYFLVTDCYNDTLDATNTSKNQTRFETYSITTTKKNCHTSLLNLLSMILGPFVHTHWSHIGLIVFFTVCFYVSKKG